MKKIAIITSGGDAPGMNAVIRAATLTGINAGCQVFGVKRGYQGLITGEIVELTSAAVFDILHRGGTVLHSARCPKFGTEAGQKKALEQLENFQIEGMVVIGGDGSFRGAQALNKLGFTTVGIPATIDNDIGCTDFSVGFDTAVNTVLDAINKIRDTASSHDRVYVVEVMGKNSGFIALYSGLSGGADAILIPEIEFDLESVVKRIGEINRKGREYSIVLVAEGLFGDPISGRFIAESSAFKVGTYINEQTGRDTRITILGHIQRGGSPSALDRTLGTRFGAKATELLLAGETNKMVGWVRNEIKVSTMDEAIANKNQVDPTLYQLTEILAAV
ncbi:MAG TPA: 6-phosphofructokinase [Firmicutes bacterium]|jgi:6-phosphofructokinase 1|nr:6-phosphofructokinase [Bacillota bacterium]HBT17420.1 6-phosphofructokinase [Bacillota bacterium]